MVGTSRRHLARSCTPALNSCIRGGCEGLPAISTSFFGELVCAKDAADQQQRMAAQTQRATETRHILDSHTEARRKMQYNSSLCPCAPVPLCEFSSTHASIARTAR